MYIYILEYTLIYIGIYTHIHWNILSYIYSTINGEFTFTRGTARVMKNERKEKSVKLMMASEVGVNAW